MSMCERLYKAISKLGEATFWQLLAEAGPRGRANLASWIKSNEQEARQGVQCLIQNGYVSIQGNLRTDDAVFKFTGKEWEEQTRAAYVGGASSYF